MINKTLCTMREIVEKIPDGSSVMVGGFGDAGMPFELLSALKEVGTKDLTIICNNAGTFQRGLAALILNKQIRKIICSHPRPPNAEIFAHAYRAGEVELECVPQGTLAERIRMAGAGLGPFFTPTGYGTQVAQGKEQKVIDGVGYILENPLKADFSFIGAQQGDRWGNLLYRYAGRNFNPLMATAAKVSIAQVNQIVELGAIPPDQVMTPGIFINYVVGIGASHD